MVISRKEEIYTEEPQGYYRIHLFYADLGNHSMASTRNLELGMQKCILIYCLKVSFDASMTLILICRKHLTLCGS